MIAKANNMIMNYPFDTLMVPEFPAGVMVKTSPSPSAPAPQAGLDSGGHLATGDRTC
jgi:hypothetical protein